jgi:hypothetical protein
VTGTSASARLATTTAPYDAIAVRYADRFRDACESEHVIVPFDHKVTEAFAWPAEGPATLDMITHRGECWKA